MSIIMGTAARNAACKAVLDLVDTPGPGRVEIYTAGGVTLLASIPLANPAFGPPAGGIANFVPVAAAIAVGTGLAAEYRVFGQAVGGTVLWIGTAGPAFTDMVITPANVVIGDSVAIVSWAHGAA